MRLRSELILSLALLSAFLALGAPRRAPVKIDLSEGAVKGVKAFGVWLQAVGDPTPRDPKGYDVVLAPRTDPASWIRFPAGTWQAPPEAIYSLLVEGAFEVSPWPSTLTWVIEPFTGKGWALTRSVVDAGRLKFASSCRGECTAWVLHEDSNVQVPIPWFAPEMLRQAPLRHASQEGILMPSGRVVVGVLDSTGKSFVGLQAPVQVITGRSVAAVPDAPKSGLASLILELNRPAIVEKRPDDDVSVALVTADGRRAAPALLTRGARRVTAVWVGVPAGAARLEVASSRWRLPHGELRLRSAKIEHLSRDLLPLPKLKLNLEIPEELQVVPTEVTVMDLSGRGALVHTELPKGTEHAEFDVPAGQLKVSAVVGPWTVGERIDLSDGRDGSVDLVMRVIRMTGRVYCGDEPARARISFDTRQEWKDSLTVPTDADGNFEALFAAPNVYFAVVTVDGREGVYADPGILVESDLSHDFHLPGNEYRFRVTNKFDGGGIGGAEIRLENVADEGIRGVQSVIADSSGQAVAPPLRPGVVTVTANAEGFEPSRPLEQTVAATGERTITIELEPREGGILTLLLPDGQPAAAAEVLIDGPLGTWWVMRTDELGRVHLPQKATDALILARAEGAAFGARRWMGEDMTWTLDPAGAPLVARALGPDGEPSPDTPAVLWLDGIRLASGPLAWVTSTRGGADTAGLWTVYGLPPRSVEILFWRATPQNLGLVPKGLFDGMRETVPYPWPTPVTLHALP